MNNINY